MPRGEGVVGGGVGRWIGILERIFRGMRPMLAGDRTAERGPGPGTAEWGPGAGTGDRRAGSGQVGRVASTRGGSGWGAAGSPGGWSGRTGTREGVAVRGPDSLERSCHGTLVTITPGWKSSRALSRSARSEERRVG